MKPIIVRGIRDIAHYMNRDKQTIRDYMKMGAPIYKSGGAYEVDIVALARWYYDHKQRPKNYEPDEMEKILLMDALKQSKREIAALKKQLRE